MVFSVMLMNKDSGFSTLIDNLVSFPFFANWILLGAFYTVLFVVTHEHVANIARCETFVPLDACHCYSNLLVAKVKGGTNVV